MRVSKRKLNFRRCGKASWDTTAVLEHHAMQKENNEDQGDKHLNRFGKIALQFLQSECIQKPTQQSLDLVIAADASGYCRL